MNSGLCVTQQTEVSSLFLDKQFLTVAQWGKTKIVNKNNLFWEHDLHTAKVRAKRKSAQVAV
jgi:hypothetical protein